MKFDPVKSKSGHIRSAGYDPQKKCVVVNFKGGTYAYEGVPESEWLAFRDTFPSEDSSTGSHFNKHLKKYPFKKL